MTSQSIVIELARLCSVRITVVIATVDQTKTLGAREYSKTLVPSAVTKSAFVVSFDVIKCNV
jgi:hypothetical protein